MVASHSSFTRRRSTARSSPKSGSRLLGVCGTQDTGRRSLDRILPSSEVINRGVGGINQQTGERGSIRVREVSRLAVTSRLGRTKDDIRMQLQSLRLVRHREAQLLRPVYPIWIWRIWAEENVRVRWKALGTRAAAMSSLEPHLPSTRDQTYDVGRYEQSER